MLRRINVGMRALVIATVLVIMAGSGWPEVREARATTVADEASDAARLPQPAPAQLAMTLEERKAQIRSGLEAGEAENRTAPRDGRRRAMAHLS